MQLTARPVFCVVFVLLCHLDFHSGSVQIWWMIYAAADFHSGSVQQQQQQQQLGDEDANPDDDLGTLTREPCLHPIHARIRRRLHVEKADRVV